LYEAADAADARVRVQLAENQKSADIGEERKAAYEQADVSKNIQLVLEPLREFPQRGTVELPIRVKNNSDKPIYGPINVEVLSIRPDGALLNAANDKNGVGATIDYSRALGDFESLPPGATSEVIVWR
jgi:hypothetical protein